jgi:hypothetical protein
MTTKFKITDCDWWHSSKMRSSMVFWCHGCCVFGVILVRVGKTQSCHHCIYTAYTLQNDSMTAKVMAGSHSFTWRLAHSPWRNVWAPVVILPTPSASGQGPEPTLLSPLPHCAALSFVLLALSADVCLEQHLIAASAHCEVAILNLLWAEIPQD